MKDLIERLEKATGPDRELDGLVYRSLATAIEESWKYWSGSQREQIVPHFTSSIDAALTLVPDCLRVDVQRSSTRITVGQAGYACVWSPNGNRSSRAASPAIALCIAALKAREAPPQSPAGSKDQ